MDELLGPSVSRAPLSANLPEYFNFLTKNPIDNYRLLPNHKPTQSGIPSVT